MLIADLADELFKAIFKRHETRQQTVFIGDHRQMKLVLLHLTHQLRDRFRFWHYFNRMQRTLDRLVASSRSFGSYQIFGEDDTNQVVLIIVIGAQHRQTTELVLDNDIDRLADG